MAEKKAKRIDANTLPPVPEYRTSYENPAQIPIGQWGSVKGELFYKTSEGRIGELDTTFDELNFLDTDPNWTKKGKSWQAVTQEKTGKPVQLSLSEVSQQPYSKLEHGIVLDIRNSKHKKLYDQALKSPYAWNIYKIPQHSFHFKVEKQKPLTTGGPIPSSAARVSLSLPGTGGLGPGELIGIQRERVARGEKPKFRGR